MSVSPLGNSAVAAAARPAFDARTKRTVETSLLTAAADKPVDAIVFFKPAAGHRSAMNALDAAEAMPLGTDRKELVYKSLQTIGNATLAANMPALEKLQAAGQIAGIDTLYSMNAVRVRGASLEALRSLVGPNVKQIIADSIVAVPTVPNALDDSVAGAAMIPLAKFEPGSTINAAEEDPNTIWMDWGTKKMDAPAAWQQGITGAGIVIASLDTGVVTDHPGLKANYRGTKADGTQDHNYNLWNGIEKGATMPIDDVGHGTHTIGSSVGNDGKHLVGVAPDATFIAGRGLGAAGGSLFSLMAGMEWMMAPTDLQGKNPRADMAPDIITNSWGGAPVSNPFLWVGLRNWRRAGIIPVFASGNDRKAQPGKVAAPGMHSETIIVGATEKDDKRAFFSMYGPSPLAKGHKPEVMAPGTYTYSTYPDGTFRDTFIIDGKEHPASGTSMATPHVAGAVALYMQAHPKAKYDEILEALKGSGVLAKNPNDESGWGRVQVDKLIAPGTIDKDAKLTDSKRVDELMARVGQAKIFGKTTPPGNPGVAPAAPDKTIEPFGAAKK